MHVAGQLTALGWTMFVLYLVAALLSFRAAVVARFHDPAALGRIWRWLGAILVALGLNKQFDLQTLLIKLGRQAVPREILLQYRLELHAFFFLVFALVIIALFAVALLQLRILIGTFGRQLPLAAGGCALVFAYIVIRAASIASMDQMFGLDLEKIPFLWLLEAGGLLLIMVQALCNPK